MFKNNVMKHHFMALFGAILFVAVVSSGAWAVPMLQMWSPDAYYEESTQTWIVPGTSYDLWVIGANQVMERESLSPSRKGREKARTDP